MFSKSDSKSKHFSLFVFYFNVSNIICSTPSWQLNCQELFNPLFIVLNNFLTLFYSHLKQLCKKVANKLNALTRIFPYFSHYKRWLTYLEFLFNRQLNYCPLIWTFYCRQSNHLINNLLQDWARWIILNNYDYETADLVTFTEEILFCTSFSVQWWLMNEMTNESAIHIKNIKFSLLKYINFNSK